MKSVEELSDRLELQDLITTYSYAIDFHRWDDLDDIFTSDATLDFTVTGGEAGDFRDDEAVAVAHSHRAIPVTGRTHSFSVRRWWKPARVTTPWRLCKCLSTAIRTSSSGRAPRSRSTSSLPISDSVSVRYD